MIKCFVAVIVIAVFLGILASSRNQANLKTERISLLESRIVDLEEWQTMQMLIEQRQSERVLLDAQEITKLEESITTLKHRQQMHQKRIRLAEKILLNYQKVLEGKHE